MRATPRMGLEAGVNGKIEGLLAEGRALLASGRPCDAALVFERILLLAPADSTARGGLEAAQAASDERDRNLDERLDAAAMRIEQGAHTDARAMLDAVVRDGGDSYRAAALQDRIPLPPGWFTRPRADADASLKAPPAGSPQGRSRAMLGAACAALFLLLGAAVAANWDALMRRLAQAPMPQEAAIAFLALPGPRADDPTIAAARRLLEDGHPARAKALLDKRALRQRGTPR